MICPTCSNSIDAKTKFCPYCDAPVDAVASRSGLDMVSPSNPAIKRYVDLYRTAHVLNGVGTTVKTIGIVAAVVIFLFWFIVGIATASETSSSPFTAQSSLGIVSFFFSVIVGGILASLVGGLFYLHGTLISAQAQLLMAHADSAVNTSPFLSDNDRAAAMSLPYSAPNSGAVSAR